MAGQNIGVTQTLDSWTAQENYVERLMDNAAFTAAHPNNTLVMAGPCRQPENIAEACLPMGGVQNFNLGAQVPLQPMMMLGSGRMFYLRNKGSISFNLGRLWVHGRSILRALYTSAVVNGLQVQNFDEIAVSSNSQDAASEVFWGNLDSELFYIPIGLAVFVRSVSKTPVAAFYMEHCMLNSWATGWAAGQPMILENITGMCDRIRPLKPTTAGGLASANYPNSELVTNTMLNGAPFTNVFPENTGAETSTPDLQLR